MKRIYYLLLFLFPVAGLFAQDLTKEFPEQITVTVTNTLSIKRENVFVFIPALKLGRAFNKQAFIVLDNGKELASQYNAMDADYSGIVTVLDAMDGNERRELQVRFKKEGISVRNYKKRTQAELSHKAGGKFVNREYIGGEFKNVDYLRVPPEQKDHSWFIRYEGPGWESDKVGYRFYLDQRNANDVFGKTTPEMVLQDVGKDGFDSYHHLQPWGMDIMKAGKSLGIASIGAWVDGAVIRVEKTDSVTSRITQNGAVYSSILTRYYGWKIGEKKFDLESRLSIHAGTRLTHTRLTFRGKPDNISTGLVKDKNSVALKDKGDKDHWGYLATYGKQSLNDDNLGMAVFFNPDNKPDFTEDNLSHIVKLLFTSEHIDYYFMAAWEKEPEGIKDQQQFEAYLKMVSQELAHPVTVSIKR